MSAEPTARGEGLMAEKLIADCDRSLDRLAVETLNNGPALRAKIESFQWDEA